MGFTVGGPVSMGYGVLTGVTIPTYEVGAKVVIRDKKGYGLLGAWTKS